jgi:prevent-host-death family protein
MSATVNIHAAKTHLSRLVERAARGEEILIARAGRPVARLGPLQTARPKRRFGVLRGRIVISDDFDAPLPRDLLDTFYRGELEPRRRR